MKSKLQIVYLPGIGDAGGAFQPWAVRTWRRWGVQSELYSMNWADDVSWDQKFDVLLRHIDDLAKNGPVALVGASAGAAAAINAYGARLDKVVGVVAICGKINNPESIGARYRKYNPSFVEAAYHTAESLKRIDAEHRRRILSRYAIFDQVIYTKADSRVPGAHNRVVPTFLHAPSIAIQLVFGAPSFIRFLKRQAAK